MAETKQTEQEKFAVKDQKGAFVRPPTKFHNKITADGSSGFPVEEGRYRLYVSMACPWACRTLAVRELKGLQKMFLVTKVGADLDFSGGPEDYKGWPFTEEDPEPHGFKFIAELYEAASPGYRQSYLDAGRKPYYSVPVLYDHKTKTIVNNESSEIIEMMNAECNALATNPDLDLSPADHVAAMEEVNSWIYPKINDGVYRSGFAREQGAYDVAVKELFDALDKAEEILSKQRYIAGPKLTLSDVRLFTTLVRFDHVYHVHFKCSKKRIADHYPALWGFTREVYQMPGVKGTVDFDTIKRHYYGSHGAVNPRRIVAVSPDIDFDAPHGRDAL